VAIRITVWIQGLFRPTGFVMGDTESGIKRLRCATLQCTAYTSRHRHNNYDVITSPTLGGGIHCPSDSRYVITVIGGARVSSEYNESPLIRQCEERTPIAVKL